MPDRLEKSLKKFDFTGTGNIAASAVVPAGQRYRYVGLTLHLSADPTVNNPVSVTLNAAAGAVYDTKLNYAVMSGQDLALPAAMPAYGVSEVLLGGGDAIDVAWTNPGGITYGLELTFEVV